MSDRFTIDQYPGGQIYVSENGGPRLHAQIKGHGDIEIQTGGHQPQHGSPAVITIDKLYGPQVFWPIRVMPDIESGDWIIERCYGPAGEWREAARIPGQLEEDFTDWSEA